MDQHKLRTLVFEKTGVRIDVDDPVFALVALNEAVLAEAVERHVAMIDDASADLAEQLQALQDNGSTCRYRPGDATSQPLHAQPQKQASGRHLRPEALAGAAALLGAVLVLLGQALWFRPAQAPPAVAPVAPPALTAQQEAQLREADKLQRIVRQLDAKTRAAIDAAMQKP